MLVGTRQPTATTVRISDGRAETYQDFHGQNDFGDATVPLAGAVGLDQELDTNRIVRIAENHGNLQNNGPVLDEVTEILGARPTRPRLLAPVELRVGLPTLVLTSETLLVDVTVEGEPAPAVTVTVRDERKRVVARRRPRLSGRPRGGALRRAGAGTAYRDRLRPEGQRRAAGYRGDPGVARTRHVTPATRGSSRSAVIRACSAGIECSDRIEWSVGAVIRPA